MFEGPWTVTGEHRTACGYMGANAATAPADLPAAFQKANEALPTITSSGQAMVRSVRPLKANQVDLLCSITQAGRVAVAIAGERTDDSGA